MAAKTWETDFRYPGIQASIRALSDVGREDPFSHPGSFCLPVRTRPVVSWTRDRLTLIGLLALVAGFTLGVIGPCLLAFLNPQVPNPLPLILLWISCPLAGLLALLSPFFFFDRIVRWVIGQCAGTLLGKSRFAQAMGVLVVDGTKSRVQLLFSGAEEALAFFDEQNRSVLIEGVGARYKIRAAEVEDISRFVWRLNLVGARITYFIDSETRLELLIARPSILAKYVPGYILEIMPWIVPNKVFDNLLRTLRPAAVSRIDETSSVSHNDAQLRVPH